MADFIVRLVANASPMPTRAWVDSATPWRESFTTEVPGRPHLHYYCAPGSAVALECIVDGDFAPGGGTTGEFTCSPLEWPASAARPDTQPSGGTDIQTVTVTTIGHYSFCIRHESTPAGASGGAVVVHFDVIGGS